MRRDLVLVGLMLAIVLVSIEGGVLLLNSGAGGIGQAPTPPEQTVLLTNAPSATPTATAAPTAAPTQTVAPSEIAVATATPTPALTPSATPTATATATARPTPPPTIRVTPRPTPAPTAVPTPVTPLPPTIDVSCDNPGGDTALLVCSIVTPGILPTDGKTWVLVDTNSNTVSNHTGSFSGLTLLNSTYSVYVVVTRQGTTRVVSTTSSGYY